MDNNADAGQSASRQQTTPTLRRRDRLRALVSLNNATRRRHNVQAPASTSRFSLTQMFFPRRSNTTAGTLHPTLSAHNEQVQATENTTSVSPIASSSLPSADTGDLLARLEALEDYFDDDHDTPPAPASPTPRQSRRLSLRLRDLVDHRLLTPRNRAATAPSEPSSRFSHYNQPDTETTRDESFTVPQRAITPSAMSLGPSESLPPSQETQSRLRPPPIDIHNNDSGLSRPPPRPRSIIEAANISMPRQGPQDRRATWGAGRPWPTIGASASSLDIDDSIGRDDFSPVSPLRQPPLQRANTVRGSLSTQSLASASPLTSLSSLFTRSASNQSSSSTLNPGSATGQRSPPVLRPGAARLATPSTRVNSSISELDIEQGNHLDRLGRIARVQTRLRRQMNSLLSRRDTDDDMDMDITSILRDIRGRLPRSRGADGSSINGEPVTEGMAPFTIVGIRRVNPGTEVTGEDNLPPYIRELLGSTTTVADEARNSSERHRPSALRHGARRRGVLSFYDRMETPSREQALQMLQRRRPRSLYGAGSLRRNGVVGPDSPDDDLDNEDTDSSETDEPTTRDDPTYIIYLIQGILPEDHPLLSAPSLFTNNPTYEDMLYIASLLGPGKPPVASESDVASAPGLFVIEVDSDGKLFAVSSETEERIALPAVVEDGCERPERCLVCLSDFEEKEEARKLIRCGHLFHKDCIDQWLTEGRNSCPLCRGGGVEEKSAPSASTVGPPT